MLTRQDYILSTSLGKCLGPIRRIVQRRVKTVGIIGVGKVWLFCLMDVIYVILGLLALPIFPEPFAAKRGNRKDTPVYKDIDLSQGRVM